ncbi:MAG: hypothetical protein AAF291_06185 [Pseudomonadota bacterium]
MQRTVITPPQIGVDALEELKGWLGISRSTEDALLADLLHASLSMCEAFTGQTPIEQTVEEIVPPLAGEYPVQSRPVRSFVSAELIGQDGARNPLTANAFDFRIDAAGQGCLALSAGFDARGVTVAFRAGIAADWSALPGALKQGVIRLAAFHYRERDEGRPANAPSSVTALWRPWRVVRLT